MTHFYAAFASVDLLQAIGVAGFLTYVLNYALLSLRLLHSDDARFFLINTVAALLVLISLSQAFNLAAALIQVFWIMIGIPAILLRLARRRSDRRADAARAPARTRAV